MTSSLERHRYKEALRTAMTAAQHGNQMLQNAAPWVHLKTDVDADGRNESLASLAFGWRICRYLAIVTQPFLPFSAKKLWTMLGITTELENSTWDSAVDWSIKIQNPPASFEPLFQRLDADEILKHEKSIIENSSEKSNPGHEVKGGKKEMKNMKEEPLEGIEYLDFDTFMKVDLRVGIITSVEDHPNADRPVSYTHLTLPTKA